MELTPEQTAHAKALYNLAAKRHIAFKFNKLSTRVRQRLAHNNIETDEQLLAAMLNGNAASWKAIGQTSLREIARYLVKEGLWPQGGTGDEPDNEQLPDIAAAIRARKDGG